VGRIQGPTSRLFTLQPPRKQRPTEPPRLPASILHSTRRDQPKATEVNFQFQKKKVTARLRRALTAAATAPPAPARAAKRKGQAATSPPPSSSRGSRRAFAVVMAAALLALAVALLVGAGSGVDRGVAAPVEAEGTEVRVLDWISRSV
jgi:hypothetical protein